MFGITLEVLNSLRGTYPRGTRVELVEMNDPYRNMPAGLQGTVKSVDSIGTIHVKWDNGSTLGVAHGVDKVILVTCPENVAWVDIKHKQYEMKEIEDSYLINILNFLCAGGGYKYFVTVEKITALFQEADSRGLSHKNELSVALKVLEDR